ncbi:MAG: hypothetical protein GF364_09420 [Candidatus Lokiarchaeota archaeon]|nr:hypothetical protein [Candidatus Lokiarchaeota archaeon]
MKMRNKDELKSDILQYLSKHNILTMATSDLEGNPDATALEYANDELDVFVSVRKHSKKVSNIKENPKVFYEIHDEIEIDWSSVKTIKAIQASAIPEIYSETDSEFDNYFNKMLKKYPIFSKLNKKKRVIVKFTPKIIWYLNYREKMFSRERFEL